MLAADENMGPADRLDLARLKSEPDSGIIWIHEFDKTDKSEAPFLYGYVTVINDGRRPNKVKSVGLLTDNLIVIKTGVQMRMLGEGEHMQAEFPEDILRKSPEPIRSAYVIDIFDRMYISPLGWTRKDFSRRWWVLKRNLRYGLALTSRPK